MSVHTGSDVDTSAEPTVGGQLSAVRVPRFAALATAAILATQLMLQLDAQVVTVALPQLQRDLGFSAAGLSWVPNAYALAFGGLMLLGGRLGDVLGRVRVFGLGTALFALASLAAGLAPDATVMIVARVVQGMGAAVAAPSILSLLTAVARDERARGRNLALFTAASSVGASFGLILGGALTAFFSWRWGLLINLPIGAVVVTLVHRLVEEDRPAGGTVDGAGAITATLGSLGLVYGFVHAAEAGWATVQTWLTFALAAALLAVFIGVERRATLPLLDLSLLRHRKRATALGAMGLIVGVHFSLLFLLVQYYQRELRMSPLVAGLAFLPLTGTILAVTHFVPPAVRRFGAGRLLVLGTALVGVSFGWFAALNGSSTYARDVLGPLLVHSVGVALVFTPGTVLVLEGVPARHSGSISGLLQMVQQVGGSLGIAVIVAVHASGGGEPDAFLPGLPRAFLAAAVLAAVAVLVALTGLIGFIGLIGLTTRHRHTDSESAA
ncbi:MFS transporter [Streptomyces sp. CRN 30]|uniref:MFS transporter n=1 Tax=Streptomyces sp. CRN 30 TaxID=3075613 RepID=UPI002A82FCDB|nr:MFS transporter [Streptomyces sp. CRN 30]